VDYGDGVLRAAARLAQRDRVADGLHADLVDGDVSCVGGTLDVGHGCNGFSSFGHWNTRRRKAHGNTPRLTSCKDPSGPSAAWRWSLILGWIRLRDHS